MAVKNYLAKDRFTVAMLAKGFCSSKPVVEDLLIGQK